MPRIVGGAPSRVAVVPKLGDPTPPVDPGELTFLAVDTRTPYTRDFDGADGGKQAHYMLRWVNTRRNRPMERNGHRDDRGVRQP